MGLMLSERRVKQIFRFHMYIPQLIDFRILWLHESHRNECRDFVDAMISAKS